MKLIHKVSDADYPVELHQSAEGMYKVVYGLEVIDKLSYMEAAEQYGYFIMHSLACAGKLNEES